jgi:uncharacterized protein
MDMNAVRIIGLRSQNRLLAFSCLLFAWLAGCSKPPAPGETAAVPGYESSILRARGDKDAGFRSGSNSPIAREERGRFKGLNYFPPSLAFRYRVQLVRYPRPDSIRLGTNTGEIRDALRYGYFEFEAGGQKCRLQVYRTMEDIQSGGRQLFVPFRDATSGQETYGAGRYIDLHENTTGAYELDFNLAYNPYCAYTKSYSCPVPPAENTLPVPIPAGEKTYRKE